MHRYNLLSVKTGKNCLTVVVEVADSVQKRMTKNNYVIT
ncbi:hypothetical protein T05_4538 [Trichinella murrelli]|uniref:Uncharacterized protein n=1 Tax=Trichinella murrelli TaxID=144512 RepID=A0A0V0SQ56_9BILA|nr:hypothetical protein T05_4538 [Trichinella murrelli]